MSGAEFGLAASVITVIGFTLQLWSESSQIRKTGSTIRTSDCAKAADKLQSYCDQVKRVQDHETNLDEAARLKAIAEDTRMVVGEFASRLSKCKTSVDQEGFRRFRDVVIALWNGMRMDVEAEMTRLRAMRDELQFDVVISMRKKIDDSDLRRSEEFRALNEELKALVEALLEGPESLELLVESQINRLCENLEEAATTRHREVLGKIDNAVATLSNRTIYRGSDGPRLIELKNRLWFSAISHRQEAIVPAHTNTFNWIFTGQQKTENSNTTFVEWMNGGDGLYWVSGRAGTGKSSLMRFLDDHPRTREIFGQWAGDRPLVLASFYFWNSEATTDPRLKSLEGLYCGLLYTIIKEAPAFAEVLFPDQLVEGRDLGVFPTFPDLKQAFKRLYKTKTPPVAVGILIDGLDEYEADMKQHIEMAELLKEAAKAPHLKITVSSRPELAFENSFRDSKKLRLHELTWDDMTTYVSDVLNSDHRLLDLANQSYQASELIEMVVERSEGIFLWTHLAVSTLQEELLVADDIRGLEKVVNDIPSGKEDLSRTFDHMLRKRIPSKDLELGLQMIQTLQYCYRLPDAMIPWVEQPFRRYIATAGLYSFFEDSISRANDMRIATISISEAQKRVEITANRLRRYSAGLLEIRTAPETRNPDGTKISSHYFDQDVSFLHKDVSIFLNLPKTKGFLEESLSESTKTAVPMNLLKCIVMVLKTHGPMPSTQWDKWVLVEAAMRIARITEEYDLGATEPLLDQLDKAVTHWLPWLLDGKNSTTTLHWAEFFPFDIHFRVEHYPWPDQDKGYSLDYLSFAVQNGLFHYVKSKLRKDTSSLARKRGLPLLSCACGPNPYWSLLPDMIQSRTAKLLLDHGANPNSVFDGRSPWQTALLVALDSWILSAGELEELGQVLRLLIQHGADPYAQVKWQIRRRAGKPWQTLLYQRTADEQIRAAFIDRAGCSQDDPEAFGDMDTPLQSHMGRILSRQKDTAEDKEMLAQLGKELLTLLQKRKQSRRFHHLMSQTSESLSKMSGDLKARARSLMDSF